MGRSRTGRLLIALAVMVLFLVAMVVVIGEVFVRPAVEDQIAKALVDEFGLSERPDVDVSGFPLVLRAMQQRLDGLDVSVEGETYEGLRVESVELRIDRISFDTAQLLRGDGTLEIGGGDGTAVITDADVSTYLESIGLPAVVEFGSDSVHVSGPVTISGVTADASATGRLDLAGDVLRFTPTTVQAGAFAAQVDLVIVEGILRQHFTFETPVPHLRGVQLTGISIQPGVASIAATFAARTVEY